MMTEHHIGQDGEVLLPMVEVQLTFALREYLEEVRALRQLTAATIPNSPRPRETGPRPTQAVSQAL